MFSLIFNGKFEVKDPNLFVEKVQSVVDSMGAEYFGKVQVENLGDYVDFQKIEQDPSESE